MWEKFSEWDRELFVYLNNLGVEEYDTFWIFVTQIRHWIPLYILFFVLFFIAFPWRKALLSTFATILTAITIIGLTDFVKIRVARLRPNNQPLLEDLIRILQKPDNFSFFSGHSASSFAITTVVVLILRKKYKWVYVFYIWPLLFASSRIFVGVHYPADVLVGAGVGVFTAYLIYLLFTFSANKFLHQNKYSQ
ncbi:MAG: phosphatase PAP2 family protein [Leeuwenhoekiella sp.]